MTFRDKEAGDSIAGLVYTEADRFTAELLSCRSTHIFILAAGTFLLRHTMLRSKESTHESIVIYYIAI